MEMRVKSAIGRLGWMFIMGCMLTGSVSSSDASLRPEELTRFTFTQYHMGIDARLVVYAKDQLTAENACRAAFARIAELDTIMSDYRVDSELNQLSAKAGGPSMAVSKDLYKVLSVGRKISQQTDGAFDVTVGPLIQLWRAARRSGKLPEPAEIEKARTLVGWRKMELLEGRVKLTTAGMKLDLGGIAKGYAADEGQKVLKKFGIKRALIQMGGDIVVSGPPPGKKGWTIRVPNAGDDKGPKDVEFSNCAVSTSGDTEQFAVIGGKRYSHVVDPRTGQALTNRVQATIIAKDGLTTDPISTALTVLNEQGRAKLLRSYRGVKLYLKVLAGEEKEDR